MVTRRRLLAAGLSGGAALLTGCGADEVAGPRPADVLTEQLRVTQLVVAAYAGVDAPRAAARARARVRKIEAALGASPPAPAGPSGPAAAYAAERTALAAHVAAVGQLGDPDLRALLSELVAGAAQGEAALAGLLKRDPLPTAFPGQPA
jgi:hypothetical protein